MWSRVADVLQLAVSQSLSGTGALRIGMEFLNEFWPNKKIYVPTPTWGNHGAIAKHAGLELQKYR